MKFIPYGKQYIDQDDIDAVTSVLKSDYLTTGPIVSKFEDEICKETGSKYAVAVCNGTAALHLSMLAAGIKENDEVILSPITFAASANAILYCGGKPVFVDINKDNLLINSWEIESAITNNTKAIVAVNFGGEICELDAIIKIADKYNLAVIQDCAHSIGSKYKGNALGDYRDMQTWSFHPVKTVTTAEGGAITTNNESIYKKLIRLRTHGITRDSSVFVNSDEGPWYYEMLDLGYNYRISDLQCALGISQLKKLNQFKKRRCEIVSMYDEAFRDFPIDVQASPTWSEPTRHLYTIQVSNASKRKDIFNQLTKMGIGVNVHYIPVYYFPYYEKLGYQKGICPNAEEYYNTAITIPLFPSLTDEQVGYVIDCVKKAVLS